MMEDDFYATLKLISGEEIFAKVSPSFEKDKTILLLSNPIVVSNVQTRNGSGYKIEPWLKTTKEDMFIIDMEKVLTITESNDIEMITMYQSYIRKFYNLKNKKPNISKRMGYIGNVNDAKELLEKIYKNL
jgi:hypothetical protein